MKKLLLSITLLILVSVLGPSAPASPAKCVNVYYDQSKDASYWMGRTYSIMLQNLLGHFPEFQQIISPIEAYRAGDIEKCEASIYIGSYFDNAVPEAFFKDFEHTSRRVAWLGYNIWKVPATSLKTMFGHEYRGLTTLSKDKLDAAGAPTFFKNVLYKGETFYKYGKFSKTAPDTFLAPFEMAMMQKTDEASNVQVLATAEHNGTGEKLPYILRGGNKFYVADVPFSFMHEADRYLVFADVLFDILGASPRHNGLYAYLRIEDIHPLVPLPYLYSITNALTSEQVPINISLIPIFFDPLARYTRADNQEFVTMAEMPEFMTFVREMQEQKATWIWHGVTHQLDRIRNPHSGASGDDFEFWDANNGRALSQDSADFVMDRLDSGFYDLQKAGITPQFWLTPHYQASPLDYHIFARVFPWNVGRTIYFNFRAQKPALAVAAEDLQYSVKNDTKAARERRLQYFRDYKVTTESDRWSGQMYPYEIYGDVYGQKLLPENLGNSQPTENEHVVQPRSVQEMVRDAKRNRVIRDVWGSFFYHAQLLNTDADGGRGRYPGDPAELLYLVRELKKLGYQFIRIEDFAKKNDQPFRPEPIYRGNENRP